MPCDGGICSGGSCSGVCSIAGVEVADDAGNPDDACQGCDVASSATRWSRRADGFPCDAGAVCLTGACEPGCFIDGGFWSSGATEPGNECAECAPLTSTSRWSPWNEGQSAACSTLGEICHQGSCTAGCFVGGSYEPPDAGNPANACEHCQPATSTTSYSPIPEESTCNADGQHFCRSDSCIYGCVIAGVGVVDAGDAKAGNPCETCQPAKLTTDYSPATDGLACGATGDICFSGQCQQGCYINGGFQNPGDSNGGNTCQQCKPTSSTSSWTSISGTACSLNGGDVCDQGSCVSGCVIGGTHYATNAANPSNACELCDPTRSLTAWSAKICAANMTCSSGTCACDANYGNCDGTLTDGCETALTTSSHCGSCLTQCSSGGCDGFTCGPKGITCCFIPVMTCQDVGGTYKCQ